MAEINKTQFKGLGLPEHFDPSLDALKDNMGIIDSILQKSIPNATNSISEGVGNLNTLTEPGTYYAKAGATGCPPGTTSYSGVIHVFKSGAYVLQEWRGVNKPSFCSRRYSTNSGSSWGIWYKEWNENNDGSGSGLDADTLDTDEATAFAKLNHSTSNFNSVKPGFWYVNSTVNAPHTSCSHWGCMVFRTGSATGNSYLIQVASARGTSNTDTSTNNTLGLFYRKYYNGTWLSWNTLYDSSRSSSGINAQFLQGFTPDNVCIPTIVGSSEADETVKINDLFSSVAYIRSGYAYWKCGDVNGLFIAGGSLVIKSVSYVYAELPVCDVTVINQLGIRTFMVTDDSDTDLIPMLKTTSVNAEKLNGHTGDEYVLLANLLNAIKNIDGSGSGIDADLLDGFHSGSFVFTDTVNYDDFNSIPLKIGVYGVTGNASHTPISTSTGTYTAIVTRTSTGFMMFAINNSDNNIYRRHTTAEWSTSTSWVNIGGTGLQQATATVVDSSGTTDVTSYYLKIERDDTSNALKNGDVISISMTNASTYVGNLCYIRYIDSTTAVTKYLYNANGSSIVPIGALPKYFLMRYDGSNFELLTPLNSNVTISSSDPTSETTGKYGDIWYTI